MKRKGYNGGRVEYTYMVSRRAMILNWMYFGICVVSLVVCLLLHNPPWVTIGATALSLVAAVFGHLRYRAQKIKQTNYYDVMSAYPKQLTDLRSPFDDTLLPLWTCGWCQRRFPLTTQDPYYSSEFCSSSCFRSAKDAKKEAK